MITEAQKKALAKYKKGHIKQIMLGLNKRTDADIIKKLETCGNKQGYIKQLIRADIERGE